MFMHALSAIYCMLTHAPPSPKKRKHRQKTDTGTSTSKQRTCSRVRGYRKKTPNGKGGSQSYTFPLPRSRVSCFCTVLCSCTPTAVLPYCRYTRRPPHTPLPGGGEGRHPLVARHRRSAAIGRKGDSHKTTHKRRGPPTASKKGAAHPSRCPSHGPPPPFFIIDVPAHHTRRARPSRGRTLLFSWRGT